MSSFLGSFLSSEATPHLSKASLSWKRLSCLPGLRSSFLIDTLSWVNYQAFRKCQCMTFSGIFFSPHPHIQTQKYLPCLLFHMEKTSHSLTCCSRISSIWLLLTFPMSPPSIFPRASTSDYLMPLLCHKHVQAQKPFMATRHSLTLFYILATVLINCPIFPR